METANVVNGEEKMDGSEMSLIAEFEHRVHAAAADVAAGPEQHERYL